MFLFIATISKAFANVGVALGSQAKATVSDQFVVWTLGSSLAAHASTWFSVSYFDQSVVFVYLTVAALGSIAARSSVSVASDLQTKVPVRQVRQIAPAVSSRLNRPQRAAHWPSVTLRGRAVVAIKPRS
jgi:hypothetical protein